MDSKIERKLEIIIYFNSRHASQFKISYTVRETIYNSDNIFTFDLGDVEIIWRLKWSRTSTKTCDGKCDRL